ncbi:rhodanese-like domain-containing protein [Chloroflexota bacterium]
MLIISLSLVTGVMLVSGCAEKVVESPNQEALTPLIEDISPQEASNLIQENHDNPDFVIIDVRTPEEFVNSHIENAINIDFRSESFKESINKLDKSKTYLVYCRTANRSRSAINIMEKLDFENIYHMLGGITQWEAAGFPITK